MEISGLLPLLIPFILLGGVQEPGLVEVFFNNICSLPQVVGPCLALLPRWWYDKETQACSKFMYDGCQGNNNNFQSESTCKAFCLKKCDYSQDNRMRY